MAISLWMITLAVTALLIMDRGYGLGLRAAVGALPWARYMWLESGLPRGPLLQPHVYCGSDSPNCEHMAEFPCCSQTLSPDCGTDTVTCNNECQLCLAWMKTKKDIQILKDGKC
ncbi:serine protease inhibitor Kazal-type 4 [Elephas maximus indicus]|uniref:serine protease inhibitor Kazal-type 4 n=1 Tax=Elephas maximus indicus TaxID=99487 RepID=UPI00211604C7|nr:serine protease inhibitor Kazal-type 4 [Elephas maximus indicus]